MYFIFNWELTIYKGKPIIIGFGYDSMFEKKAALVVKGYPMYKYSNKYEVNFSNQILNKYLLRNYLNGKQSVYKVFFNNINEYKNFNSTLLNIDIVSNFLVDQNLDTIGWVRIEGNQDLNLKEKFTTIENEYIVYYKDVIRVECNKYPECSVLSFDIECMSHDLISFPNCHQFDDFISTISIVYRYKETKKSFAICYKSVDNNDNQSTNNNDDDENSLANLFKNNKKKEDSILQENINLNQLEEENVKNNFENNLIQLGNNINTLNISNDYDTHNSNDNTLNNNNDDNDDDNNDNNNNSNDNTSKVNIIYVSSELALLKEFFNQIRLLDPDIIIGYNILGFDYHYLTRRAGMYIKEEFNASRINNRITEFNDFFGENITEIFFPGRLNIDMYLYAKTLNLPVSSLNYVSEKLLNKKKIDLPYKEMFKLIYKGDEASLQKVAHYCIVDSELTMDIFDVSHQWIQLLEIAKISRIRIDNIYGKGQSVKFTNLLYQYCHQNDICINIDSAGVNDYHGATVLEPTPGVYNLCSMLDFTSLYPSIIITHNICYTTLLTESEREGMNPEDYHKIDIGGKTYYYTKQHMGILPRMMKVLLTERVKFKELMKTATGIDKIIYDKRQWALKIQANSIYGCLGSKSLKYLRFLPGAECTTGMGRNYLHRAIQLIKETPFDIIYGDTDSCLVKCDILQDPELFVQNSKRIAQYVTDNLPEGMHLKYENTFCRLIIISKKKYSGILVHSSNKFYTKGMDTVKKNNSQYIRDSYQTLIKMIFEGASSEQIRDYIVRLKSDLLEGRVPKEQLIMKMTINKKYKSKSFYALQFLAYHRKHNLDYKVGEKVEYLIVESLFSKSIANAKLGDKVISMDLYKHIQDNDPQNLPAIDYNYYYNHYMKTSLSALLNAYDPLLLKEL